MTAPSFMAATSSTDGLTVQMLFDQPLSTPTAPASAFAVMVAAAAATISAVSVSGSQVNLTLSAAITHGQAVTVAYTAPAADAAATNNAIQNAAGEDAASVATASVTNNVPVAPVTPPVTPPATPTTPVAVNWTGGIGASVVPYGTEALIKDTNKRLGAPRALINTPAARKH